jgi:hypothetical protein
MASSDSKIKRLHNNFQTLTSTAASLNNVSNELSNVVAIFDDSLKKLNVGLTVWVDFASGDAVGPSEYDDYQIGYLKLDGKWGIGLRHVWGDTSIDADNVSGPWLFNDAPRELRLQSLDAIPRLIEKLSEEASDTAKRIENKTEELRVLAGAISAVANGHPRTPTENSANSVIHTSGISTLNRDAILNKFQEQKKFIGGLLQQSMLWKLIDSRDLEIYFSVDKRAFAELLETRESLANVNRIAEEILGHPVRTTTKIFNDGKATSSAAKGRK